MNKNVEDGFLKSVFVTRTLGYIDIFPRRELWKQVSSEFSGDLKITKTKTSEIEIHKMILKYKNWELVISESDTRPLRFELEFQSQLEFKLIIGQEDALERLMKFFGSRELEIDNLLFDQKYLIKSNNTELARSIFSDEITADILKYNLYSLSYTTNSKKSISKLIAVVHRHVESKTELIGLINLFFSLIDKLEENLIIKQVSNI